MENETNYKKSELLQEGKTLYILHDSGICWKGEKRMCNKFSFSIQPDYARGITDEDAVKYGIEIKKAVNMHQDLIDKLKKSYSILSDIHISWPGRNTHEGQMFLQDLKLISEQK